MDLEQSNLPIPRPIRIALEDKPADSILGYRFVIQYEEELSGYDAKPLMDQEIRLVDGTGISEVGYGPGYEHLRHSTDIINYGFEHAFIQLCLSGKWREEYRLVDVPGSDGNAVDKAFACRNWLREWISSHQDPSRIKDREAIVKKLKEEGRRVPFKIHIWYRDVWDPALLMHSKRMARGHQDMWVWVSSPELEALRKYLLQGSTGPYGHILSGSMSYSAKMQMDETLKEDCNRHLIDGEWAEGEKERLTKGLRFLTEEDVALLKSRLESEGEEIAPEVLFKDLENTYAWERTWTRETGHLWRECYLLPGGASKMDDSWDWDDTPIRLSGLPVKHVARLLREL
jgi:hypothetical protein